MAKGEGWGTAVTAAVTALVVVGIGVFAFAALPYIKERVDPPTRTITGTMTLASNFEGVPASGGCFAVTATTTCGRGRR